MKKLTKITALALALALVLGMTVMAAPSTLLFEDDFSEYADTTALKSGRTSVATPDYAGIQTVRETTPGGNKFYTEVAGTDELVLTNGRAAFTGNTSIKNSYTNGLVYATTEPWTAFFGDDGVAGPNAETGLTDDKALIYQVTARPTSLAATHGDATFFMRGFWNGTTNNVLFFTLKSSAITETSFVQKQQYNLISETDPYYGGDFRIGKDVVLQVLARPIRYTSGFSENATTGFTKAGLSTGVNRKHDFGNMVMNYNTVSSLDAISIMGNKNVPFDYSHVMAYELSLEPTDFAIDDAATVTSDIGVDAPIEVVTTQPLSAQLGAANGQGYTDYSNNGLRLLADNIDVYAGASEEPLAKSAYTVEISEKIEGTAVKGVLTITPATEWEANTSYRVVLPAGTKNAARISMAAADEITVTTEAAPVYDVTTLTANAGLNTSGSTVTNDGSYEGTVYFSTTASLTSGRGVEKAIVIGIYEGETLVKYAAMSNDFATSASKTFGAAFKLEAGQTARAWVK